MNDELVRLGFALELATGRAVRRRRARLQALRGSVLALVLAVAALLGAAAGTVSDSTGPLPDVPRIVDSALLPPTIAFLVRHIPDENAESRVPRLCLDGRDCRSPTPPTLEPAPPGKV